MTMESVDLGKTQITDKIRVSSAAILYAHEPWGPRWQVETWIFSDDRRQASRQIIHGSVSHPPEQADPMWRRAVRVNEAIAKNLAALFAPSATAGAMTK